MIGAMSLATRCTACGTVFRVVQDQLKVSEGWVRCGRCNEVFNALAGLFDLERETAPEWSPAEEPGATAAPGVDAGTESARAAGLDAQQVDRLDAQLLQARHRDTDSTPAMRIDERDRLEFPDARFDPDAVDADAADLAAAAEPMLVSDAAPAAADAASGSLVTAHAAADDALSDAPPEFLRNTDRRASPTSPLVRASLFIAALLLLAALALQGVHHFRDDTAARWPATRPALEVGCLWLRCSIQPPRHIDDITVESSALTRAPAPDAFKLSVALRNRGTTLLALPSVDLSLTDQTGQLVARRVLSPVDFKAPAASLAAGAEAPLQLVFQATNVRVSGYTVEVFYP